MLSALIVSFLWQVRQQQTPVIAFAQRWSSSQLCIYFCGGAVLGCLLGGVCGLCFSRLGAPEDSHSLTAAGDRRRGFCVAPYLELGADW